MPRLSKNAGLCKVEGCGRHESARGYCDSHHQRLLKYGDAMEHVPIGSVKAGVRLPDAPPRRTLERKPSSLMNAEIEVCVRRGVRRHVQHIADRMEAGRALPELIAEIGLPYAMLAPTLRVELMQRNLMRRLRG